MKVDYLLKKTELMSGSGVSLSCGSCSNDVSALVWLAGPLVVVPYSQTLLVLDVQGVAVRVVSPDIPSCGHPDVYHDRSCLT